MINFGEGKAAEPMSLLAERLQAQISRARIQEASFKPFFFFVKGMLDGSGFPEEILEDFGYDRLPQEVKLFLRGRSPFLLQIIHPALKRRNLAMIDKFLASTSDDSGEDKAVRGVLMVLRKQVSDQKSPAICPPWGY